MRVRVPEGVTVKYYHSRPRDPWGQLFPGGGTTTAKLFNEAGELLAEGMAQCHLRDNFNKRIGRDIALGRALKNFNNNVLPQESTPTVST